MAEIDALKARVAGLLSVARDDGQGLRPDSADLRPSSGPGPTYLNGSSGVEALATNGFWHDKQQALPRPEHSVYHAPRIPVLCCYREALFLTSSLSPLFCL